MHECLLHRKNPSQGYPYSNDNNAKQSFCQRGARFLSERGGGGEEE